MVEKKIRHSIKVGLQQVFFLLIGCNLLIVLIALFADLLVVLIAFLSVCLLCTACSKIEEKCNHSQGHWNDEKSQPVLNRLTQEACPSDLEPVP